MISLIAFLAIAPVQKDQDWTHMWSIQTYMTSHSLGHKVVGRTVLSHAGVLYLDTGKIEKLTIPGAYVAREVEIDPNRIRKTTDFHGRKLRILSEQDGSFIGIDDSAGVGMPWLFQATNDGKLIGSVIRKEYDVFGESQVFKIDWAHRTMFLYNSQEYSGLYNTRLYILSPLRRANLNGCYFSDWRYPKRGFLAFGQEPDFDKLGDREKMLPLMLANPYTGKKLWIRKDCSTGYWISKRHILAQESVRKPKWTRIRWEVLDAKTGRTAGIRVPEAFDRSGPYLWTHEPFVIFAKNGWLHCYRFNRK